MPNSIPGLKNAVFIQFKIRNLSGTDYNDTRIGFWEDIELGYGFDDYIGVDTIRRMGICYNADSTDETAAGYGTALTQTGCILLKTPDDSLGFGSFVFNNNDASPSGNPVGATEYHNYLSGKWRDGQAFTDACNARDPGDFIKYVYPSEPNDVQGWSERQCAMVGADRRFLINSSTFKMLNNQEYLYQIAYVNVAIGSSNVDFTALKSVADTVLLYPSGWGSGIVSKTPTITLSENISIYPNPSSHEIEIKCNNAIWRDIQKIELFTTDGKSVVSYSNNNMPNRKINIQHLNNGLYFIKISGDGLTFTNKFLKK
ncbi:MAG: T9SS type A sorting domain-containing protein [Bacteroidetes bacterium]|nr:T9SS type A sorting domain-containing protein [Bacteroidota bacterium]